MKRRQRYLFRFAIQLLCGQCLLISILAVGLWFAGRIYSDRTYLSQWLLWIPTPMMLPAAILGLAGILAPGRKAIWKRKRLWGWVLVTLSIGIYFSTIEHRLFRSAPDAGRGFSLAYWNRVYRHTAEDHSAVRNQIIHHLADINILLDAWGLSRDQEFNDLLPPDMTVRTVNRFAIVTRFPIIEIKPLVRSNEFTALMLRLAVDEESGESVVIYAIDLPSNPFMRRYLVGSEMQGFLNKAEAPTPDIVVGDFNMTRGSYSMRQIFPEHHHAYDDGGHGYAASYHRIFPLYHLDHILLADHYCATRYDLMDPGFDRHYLQRAWLTTRE